MDDLRVRLAEAERRVQDAVSYLSRFDNDCTYRHVLIPPHRDLQRLCKL